MMKIKRSYDHEEATLVCPDWSSVMSSNRKQLRAEVCVWVVFLFLLLKSFFQFFLLLFQCCYVRGLPAGGGLGGWFLLL